VAAFGLVVALAGVVLWFRQEPPPTDVRRDNSVAASGSASATPPPARIAAWRPGAPRSIRIERLGVRSPVQPIHAVGDTLVPPGDPTVLGWWADAPARATPGEACW
jgi:hypothetical protein